MKVLSQLRSRGRLVALALLPALLLRAFTPAGFMPMHDAHGDLYLAFCPGLSDTLLLPSAGDDPHRGHHAMHDHSTAHSMGGALPASLHHDLCPYALSAGPALAYAVPIVSAPVSPVDAAPPPDYPTAPVPSIYRAQSARAPPAPRIA
jgi:hypothetical protein